MVNRFAHSDLVEWLRQSIEPWASRAPFGVGVVDEDRRFCYVNRALSVPNGLSEQGHLGQRADELIPGLRGLLSTGIEDFRGPDVDVGSDRPGGQVDPPCAGGWVMHRLPLTLNGEQAALSVVFDTAPGPVETALMQRSNATLRTQNDLLATVASGIAHDLRSPLASALMQMVLARRAISDGNAELALGLLSEMESTLRHGSAMAGGLVRLTKTLRIVGADAVELDRMAECSWRAVVTARDPAGEASIRIERPLPMVLGDEALLRDVFQNLFENALKYGREGVPVRVTVRGALKGDRVVVRVSDNGRGVPKSARKRVSQDFTGGGSSGGAGLGLALVERIVQVHDGTLSIEPNEPHGSVFVLEFRAARVDVIGEDLTDRAQDPVDRGVA